MPQSAPDPLARYARQVRYAPLGEEGQRRLAASRALVCGCGALGSVIANTLARAGVGRLRIVDRDFLELNNLQRQVLYDEADVASGLPKAIAAAAKLRAINSQIEIEPIVADVDHRNISELTRDVDVIVDGTDNFEIRFLLNDASRQFGIPWVYGGCLGAEGQTMTILPGETPCLRCLMQDAPPPGTTETCDTAGILGPIINVIASIQACEALKILAGRRDAVSRVLQVFDLWDNTARQVRLESLRATRDSCPTCSGAEFPWLHGRRGSQTAVLCGRNAVQLAFPDQTAVALDQLAQRLTPLGSVVRNRYLLRFQVDKFLFTVFPDGRTIVGGTSDLAEARSAYARYFGN
ncbi:MAG: ThiF family adenylyltransferase [Pirellulales bacterium]